MSKALEAFERLISPVARAERQAHVATTAHVQSLYPFTSQASLGARGVLVGPNVYGGPFAIDQWELYMEGVLNDPNILVLGLKGFGKSGLLKTFGLRQRVYGRRLEMLDGKGEYGPLVGALDGVFMTVGRDGSINPLERIGSQAGRESLLRTVARALLGRELRPVERVGLTTALAAADAAHDGEVLIPDVVEQIRRPGRMLTDELLLDADAAADQLRELGYALRDLSTGPLRGMFDRPTSTHIDWSNPVLAIDLSAIAEHTHGTDQDLALGIALTATTAFLDARRAASTDDAKTIRINDEAWRALSVPGAADYYSASLKLSRKSGVSYVIALHRFSDLSATGDAGTRQQQLAEGLAAECATRVVYRQDPQEVDTTARALLLTSTERELLTTLGQGEALWRVGERGFRVAHEIADSEWGLIDTDRAMGGRRVRRTVG